MKVIYLYEVLFNRSFLYVGEKMEYVNFCSDSFELENVVIVDYIFVYKYL